MVWPLTAAAGISRTLGTLGSTHQFSNELAQRRDRVTWWMSTSPTKALAQLLSKPNNN